MGSIRELKIGGGFVPDLQAIQLDNTDEFRLAFPHLSLLKLHERYKNFTWVKKQRGLKP